MEEAALNCISLSNPDIQKSVSLLKQACSDSGIFYVIDHGISLKLMDEVFYESKRFFNLPLHEKMKLFRNEKLRGYTPILHESLDPQNEVHGEYKEGYYIGIEIPEDDPRAKKLFFGPNQWPSKDILPRWRQVMEQYHKESLKVAQSVAKIIALALDLDSDFFTKPEILGAPLATLRLLHYEGKTSNPSKGIFGCGAHSDYDFLTLLTSDDVVALQICKDKDARPQIWEYVAPLKGAFVVNLGDLLERWSNNVFRLWLQAVKVVGNQKMKKEKEKLRSKPEVLIPVRSSKCQQGRRLRVVRSTLHRVIINEQERYSIALFFIQTLTVLWSVYHHVLLRLILPSTPQSLAVHT